VNVEAIAWSVEEGVFPVAEEARLITALHQRGITCHRFKAHEFRNHPDIDATTVPRGSCYFIQALSSERGWRRDLFGLPEDFACTSYFPRFGSRLVNRAARFMSLGELCWTHPSVVQELGGADETLFIRPDDGFKSFEGGIVTTASFSTWVRRLEMLQVPQHTRVVVAPITPLQSEWRIAMVNGRAVAASQYRPDWRPGAPASVLQYAEECHPTAGWTIGAYSMDLAQTPRGLEIVEVGSLLCVAWYEADPGTIVDALTEVV
jgi:hypothetical protein